MYGKTFCDGLTTNWLQNKGSNDLKTGKQKVSNWSISSLNNGKAKMTCGTLSSSQMYM